MPSKKRWNGAVLVALGFLALNIVWLTSRAEQTSAPSSSSDAADSALEEVVVVAQRRAEPIDKVPVAVSAFSGDTLKDLVVNDSQDLNKLSAGLQTNAAGGNTQQESFWIRGQGQPAGGGQSPGVIPYFAEVPNFVQSYLDLQDVEIVEGPQGTLFGETATGGVVLFTPKKPTNDFDGFVRTQLGSNNLYDIEGALGGPLIPDKLFVRLAAQTRQRDGYTEAYISGSATPVDFDNVDYKEVRLSIVWRPIEDLENYTILERTDSSSNGGSQEIYGYLNKSPLVSEIGPSITPSMAAVYQYYSGFPAQPGVTWAQLIQAALAKQRAVGPRTVFTDTQHGNEEIFDGLINQTRWDISPGIALRNIFSVSSTKQAGGPNIDTDGSDLPLLSSPPQSVAPGADPYVYGKKNITEEVQVQGNQPVLGRDFKWQSGFYYRLNPLGPWTGPLENAVAFATPVNNPATAAQCASYGVSAPCGQLTRTHSDSWAPYGQATFEILKNLNLTGGVRDTWVYSNSQSTGTAFRSIPFNGVAIPVSYVGSVPESGAQIATTQVPRISQLTYTASLDWQVTDSTLAYVTNRTGFKTGGVNSIAPPDSPFRIFGPEHVMDTEIGVKGRWDVGGIRIRTATDLFQDKYSDIQETTLVSGLASTITQNVAGATIRGAEFNFTIELSKWFDVSGFYTYMDGFFTNWTEKSTCAAMPYQPACAGSLTPTLTINHADGYTTASNGNTTSFAPDPLPVLSKNRYSIRPAVHLGFLGDSYKDMTLSANIYYVSSFATGSGNNAYLSGPLGLVPSYTQADMRFDWKNILASRISLAGQVTNVTNRVGVIQVGDAASIDNTLYAIYSEPRMYYAEIKYGF